MKCKIYHLGKGFLLLLCTLFTMAVFAQTGEIAGKVTDDKGTPLAGVTVESKGSNTTTATDGSFRIRNVSVGNSLKFTFVGYADKSVAITRLEPMSISLSISTGTLNDVVVVGYGTQKKRAVTGAVTTVNYDKFKDRSFSDVSQALAGQMPGVNITQSQGAPGQSPNIRIRGVSSITAGTTPLYVVDGMPLENFNLNNLNPQDIESVDVLKDASSAAIYGSRGANGVIIVTTKLGKSGKNTVNGTLEYGIAEVKRRIDLMDAQQFIQYYVDAHNNGWVLSGPGRSASDPNSVRTASYKIPDDFLTNPGQFGKGTDWQDVMFRKAEIKNANVSVSGGTDKTQYLFSASYLDQKAVLDRNYYKRLSIRSNIRQKLSDRFTVGINLGLNSIYDRTDGTLGKSDVVSLALQSDPIFPVYNELGNLGFKDPNSVWNRFASYTDLQLWHPYSLTRFIDKQNKSFNTLANAYLEYKIIDGLKFRSSINGNLYNNRYNSYRYKNQGYGYSSNLPAEGYVTSSFSLNWLSENTLNYEKQFGDHNITALAGYTTQKQRDEYEALTSGNYPNDLVQTLNAGVPTSGTSTATEWSLISYLARVGYNYENKYFLTGTIRRDGSSRFGINNRWGVFPSVSAGWLISDEGFMKNMSLISTMKLRASYGVAGNNQIPNYGPVSLLGTSNYVSGSTLVNGLTVLNIANPNLKWEKTTQLNVGLDIGLIKNRLNLTLDFYNSITNNLLLNVPVPDITGFATQLTNIGKMRNRGFEFGLNSKNIAGKFSWTTDFNISLNRNKVLQLGPGNAPLIYTDFVVTTKTEVGQPISNFYGYIFDGVFKNQDEISKYPHDATTTPGDPKVRDVNGDGQITDADRTTLGNYQPNFIAGITNTFSYKGVEFSFLLTGSYGGEITNQLIRYNGIWNGGRNAYADVANYWRSESSPGDGIHFKPNVSPKGLQEKFSSYWVEDGSFTRIKNVRISYAIPAKALGFLKVVKSARVYVNAENVYLFSKYKNYDPENTTYPATSYTTTGTSNTGSASSALPPGIMIGVDYGSYPVPRLITFGAKLEF